MMQSATKPSPDKSISITELEQELQTEEAFDELECGKTDELSVPTFVDPDEETTTVWEITQTGIHEIKPSQMSRWINDDVEVFWVSFR
jgi:hypothetical protein